MTWRNQQGAAAVAVIAVTIAWRGVLLRDSFFNQDDFVLTTRALNADMSWDYLFTPYIGHVTPAQQLTYWLASRLAPLEWPATALFILTMQVLCCVVMWHLLTRLLPGRWVRVSLLAVFAWSPLTLATSLWWSAAMGLWPHVLFSLLAVLFVVRAHQGAGSRRLNLTICVLAVMCGLTWHERSVLIPFVVLGVVVLLSEETGIRRVTSALARYRGLWAVFVVLVGAYLVGHSVMTTVEGGGAGVAEMLKISGSFVGENVIPGLLGGPWVADLQGGAVEPHAWVTVVCSAAALVLVLLLVTRGGPAAGWAMALLALYVLADLSLVLAGRSGFGRVIGLDPRYSSDVVHAAVLAVALALRGSDSRFRLPVADDRWARARTVGLAVGTGAYLLGCIVGTATLVPHFQNTEDRGFVEAVRQDVAADPNQVIVDALVPAFVVLPLFGDESSLSQVLQPLPDAPQVDQPSPRLRVVDESGRLRPILLVGATSMRSGPVERCGYPIRSATVDIELLAEVQTPAVVRIGYFTDEERTVDLEAGSVRTQFQARPGPNEIWIPLPPEQDALEVVSLSVADGGVVCVAELEAGLAVPRAQ